MNLQMPFYESFSIHITLNKVLGPENLLALDFDTQLTDIRNYMSISVLMTRFKIFICVQIYAKNANIC